MKTRVLVTVKTYPTISTSYKELVCTAGFRENGSWIRIYPIPFRHLDYERQYKKYQWITLDLEKNTKDHRPESFRPVSYEDISLEEVVSTEKTTWRTRRKLVLNNVYTSMEKLLEDKRIHGTSLAVFKPKTVKNMIIQDDEREWDKDKLAMIENQTDLFSDASEQFKVVDKIPYKFKYRWVDEDGAESSMRIIDWEIGSLYRNCLKTHNGDERAACDDVYKKYFSDYAQTKDIHFFLGTTLQYHGWANNPFTIIGVFPPPPEHQTELDLR